MSKEIPVCTSGLFQCLLEVPKEIIEIFDPHTETDQIIGDAEGFTIFWRYAGMSHNGRVFNEGYVQVASKPYGISYRAIIPARGQCTNLIVPVCCSCSHIAYGSLRMEPVFMVLGQSAATAACQALDAGVAVQDLPYAPLRDRLLADGQVLAWSE